MASENDCDHPADPAGRALALVRAFDRRLDHRHDPDRPDPFFAGASLYGLDVRDPEGLVTGDEGAFRQCFIAAAPYVYDLLEGASAALARLYDAAAVVTTGWSAPTDDLSGMAPRWHPQRRRVRLVVVVDDGGLASALRFADDPDQVAWTTSGRGPLGDALSGVWSGGANSRSLTM